MRHLVIVAVLGLTCVACTHRGGDFFQAYRTAHPAWKPNFPRRDAGLYEVLASVEAPRTENSRVREDVVELRVARVADESWLDIP
jgi:hypothetical protein